MIEFYNKEIEFPSINTDIIIRWISKIIIDNKKLEGEVTFIFCSDNYLLNINKEYLKHNYFTDIITFNFNEGKTVSGDIFISLDTIQSNAIEYETTFDDELKRVMIHGILHLIGFDDKTEKQKLQMRKKEDEALNSFLL